MTVAALDGGRATSRNTRRARGCPPRARSRIVGKGNASPPASTSVVRNSWLHRTCSNRCHITLLLRRMRRGDGKP